MTRRKEEAKLPDPKVLLMCTKKLVAVRTNAVFRPSLRGALAEGALLNTLLDCVGGQNPVS